MAVGTQYIDYGPGSSEVIVTGSAPQGGSLNFGGGDLFGSLVSTLGGLYGAKRQNQQAVNAANAQMAFQERMSNTAHQREVADLRAAGLNPILSAGGGGASTPSGAMAPVVNELASAGEGFSRMLAARRFKSELANVNAQTRQSNAQTELAGQSQEESKARQAQYVQATEQMRALMPHLVSSAASAADADRADADIRRAAVAAAENEGEIAESGVGKALQWIDRVSRSIQGASASGVSTHEMLRPGRGVLRRK